MPDGSTFDPFMALEIKSGYLGAVGGKWNEDDVYKIDRALFEEWDAQFSL
jgi:hypothetical protein